MWPHNRVEQLLKIRNDNFSCCRQDIEYTEALDQPGFAAFAETTMPSMGDGGTVKALYTASGQTECQAPSAATAQSSIV